MNQRQPTKFTLQDTTHEHFQVSDGTGDTHFIFDYCSFATILTVFYSKP